MKLLVRPVRNQVCAKHYEKLDSNDHTCRLRLYFKLMGGRSSDKPHRILVVACAHSQAAAIQTSVWLHTLFSGEPADGDPALRHAAPLTSRRLWATSWPRRRFLLLFGAYLFPPELIPVVIFFTTSFFVVVVFVLRAGHIFRRSKVDASVLASHTSVFAPCAAPPWQWIDFGVFSPPSPPYPLLLPTSGSNKLRGEKKLSLQPATRFLSSYMFCPTATLSVPAARCFFTF